MKSRAKGNQFKPFFLETCGPSAKSSRLSEETTKEILKKLKTADDGSTKCMDSAKSPTRNLTFPVCTGKEGMLKSNDLNVQLKSQRKDGQHLRGYEQNNETKNQQ